MSALRCRPWQKLASIQNASAFMRASQYRLITQPSTHTLTNRAITTSASRLQANSSKSYPPAPQSTSTPLPPSSPAARASEPAPNRPTTDNISKSGLLDKPLELESAPEEKIDWTRSFHGLSAEPFPKEAADILLAETNPEEVEVKPDGIVYLPEIKYRRILNRAFGPGAWGLVPRGESIVTPKTVTREYALVCNGR